MTITIPVDTRYGTSTSLNFSSLARFVSYDRYGTPTYNLNAFLNAPQMKMTEAILIGTICDEILTEGVDFDLNYYTKGKEKTVDDYKAELVDEAKTRAIATSKWKKDDWKAFYEEVYWPEPVDTRIELPQATYDIIKNVLDSHQNYQYDASRTILDFWDTCTKQKVIEDRGRKGKLDFHNEPELIIGDLKVVWSLEMFLSDFSFQWYFNTHHRYMRQLAFYNDILGGNHRWQLYVTDHNGNHITIDIPTEALLLSQALNERDIAMLEKQLTSPQFFATFRIPEPTAKTATGAEDPFN